MHDGLDTKLWPGFDSSNWYGTLLLETKFSFTFVSFRSPTVKSLSKTKTREYRKGQMVLWILKNYFKNVL